MSSSSRSRTSHSAPVQLMIGNFIVSKWEFFLLVPWKRIVWFFKDDPTMIERLRLVSMEFRTICSNADLRAAYFLESSCRHLVLHHVYERFPYALTTDVMAALLHKRAVVPKYFVELVHREQLALVVSTTTAIHSDSSSPVVNGKREKPLLARSMLEFLVAQGSARYPNSLLLGVGESVTQIDNSSAEYTASDDCAENDITRNPVNAAWTIQTDDEKLLLHDDLYFFNRAMANPSSNINQVGLKKVLFTNHFTPGLEPPQTPADWDEFWGQLLNLLRVDSKTAEFVMQHTGLSNEKTNDGLVARAIRDHQLEIMTRQITSSATERAQELLSFLEENKLHLTEGSVVLVLASPDLFPLDTPVGKALLQSLKHMLPSATLATYALKALGLLFRDGKRAALQSIDILLDQFLFSPEAVSSVFLATPTPATATTTTSTKTLPFMTAHGQAQGGMTDPLWQLIVRRYGAAHPFAAACLVDTVIGGTLLNPIARPSRFQTVFAANASASAAPSEAEEDDDRVVVVASDGSIKLKRTWERVRAEMRAKRERAAMEKTWEEEQVREKLQFLYTHNEDSGIAGVLNGLVDTTAMRGPEVVREVNALFDRVAADYNVIRNGKVIMGDDERRRDLAGKDSIESMLEAAHVPLDAGMVGPVIKAVYTLKYARGRIIDFMARVEQNLFASVCFPNDLVDEEYSKRWNKDRWIAVLRQHVVESRVFIDHTLTEAQIQELEAERRKRRTLSNRISSGIFSNPMFSRVLAPDGRSSPKPGPSETGRASPVHRPESPFAGPSSPSSSRSSILGSATLGTLGRSLTGLVRSQAKTLSDVAVVTPQQKKRLDFQMPSREDAVSTARDTAVQLYIRALGAAASAVDLLDPEWSDVRRFYRCCEELVFLLGDESEAAVIRLDRIVRGEEVGPFSAWMEELEEAAAVAEVDREREEAGLAPVQRSNRLSKLASAVVGLPGSVAGWVWKEEDEQDGAEESPKIPKSANRLSTIAGIPGSVTGWVGGLVGTGVQAAGSAWSRVSSNGGEDTGTRQYLTGDNK